MKTRFLPATAFLSVFGAMFLSGRLAAHAGIRRSVVLLVMVVFPVCHHAAWQLYFHMAGRRREVKRAALFLFFVNFWVSSILQLLNPFALLVIGAQYLAMIGLRAAPPDTPPVRLRPPFRGEWLVGNGGTTRRTSHSWTLCAQRYAYDFVVGTSLMDTALAGTGRLEDYPAFGQAILAPVDGKIAALRSTCRDSPTPGSGLLDWWERDPRGNYVLIECQPDVFVLLAHLRRNSVGVRVGQTVRAGDKIGECGNSGFSTEPHLHLGCQRGKGIALAVGLPISFVEALSTPAAEIQPDNGLLLQRGMQVEAVHEGTMRLPNSR